MEGLGEYILPESAFSLKCEMDSSRDSLKEKCLCVILENFARYHAAFKLSKGSVEEKHFKYLERAFSETLLHRLIICGELKEEYFDLLINPHLKQLNLKGIDEQLIPGLVDQLRNVENNIKFLKAEFWRVKLDHYKQLISCVPNVEVIEISDIVHPEVLKEIGKRCPLLRVLKLLSCDVDDVGLMNAFMNTNDEYEDKFQLEQLDISYTLVTDVGVSFVLSHAPSLKCLEYNNVPKAIYEKHKNDLENNCFEECEKYSLTSLSFPWQKNMLDTLKICTILCPDISSLSIHCLESDEQLFLCSKFRHLKDLKIFVEGNPFSFQSINQFLKTRGRGLLSLNLKNGCISAQALVECCPKLCSLRLCSVNYEPLNRTKCLLSKAKLSSLKTLAITYSNFSTDETVDSVKLILSNAKGIKTMDFSGAKGLTESFVRSLFHLGLLQVHELNLNFSDVTVSPITEVLTHGNLQRLSVSNCTNITETECFHLLSCKADSDVLITWTANKSGEDGFDPDNYMGCCDDYAYNECDTDDYSYDYCFGFYHDFFDED